MNLCCNKCQEWTRSSGNIRMIHKAVKINMVYSYCFDCDFIKAKVIYEEDINFFSRKTKPK